MLVRACVYMSSRAYMHVIYTCMHTAQEWTKTCAAFCAGSSCLQSCACVCVRCAWACMPATRACMCMAVCICMHAFGHPHVRIVRVCKQSVFIGMSRKTCVCVSLDESSTLFSLGTFVDQCRETERESVCVCAGRHKAYVQIMQIHAHAHTNIH
jgi:hypothetical protein